MQDDLAKQLDELGSAYDRKEDGIEVKGKAAHAMVAEEGVNAIARLCLALHAMGVESKAVRFMAEEIGEDPYAARIFGECADESSGKLKFNVGKIHLGAVEQLSIDCRIPVTIAKDEIVSKPAAARYGLEYKEFDWLAPIYVPRDSALIRTLMEFIPRSPAMRYPNPLLRAAQPTPGRSTTAWRSGRSFPVSC